MHHNLRFWILSVLAIISIVVPSFILALAILIPLSVYTPLVGVAFGFILDVIFGVPTWLPSVVAYPFTLGALCIAVGSMILTRYLR